MVDAKDIDDWLAARESKFSDLRDGCAKRVVWHDKAGEQTRLSLVYVHGFSATGEELRPLPDLVANALGANLFFTRLAGHGQDGPALGRATSKAWRADVDEALHIGAAIGDEVIVMGCSTGCPLVALALADRRDVKGAIFVSPNFGLRMRPIQWLLDAPGSRHWGHLVAGRARSFEPINDRHAAYWTTRYPVQAVYPMGDTVRAARLLNYDTICTPLFCALNKRDQVISPSRAARIMNRWAGPVTRYDIAQTSQDDVMGHVMAGDVFSPGQTAPLADAIIRWAKQL